MKRVAVVGSFAGVDRMAGLVVQIGPAAEEVVSVLVVVEQALHNIRSPVVAAVAAGTAVEGDIVVRGEDIVGREEDIVGQEEGVLGTAAVVAAEEHTAVEVVVEGNLGHMERA